MTGWITRGCKSAALLALALSAGACTLFHPSHARPTPPPAKPRFTASASTLPTTNEWRSVLTAVHAPTTIAPTNAAPVVKATPATPVTVAVAVPLANAGVAYRLRPGDPIHINLRGIPKEDEIDNMVDESGFVKLPYLERVKAEGLACSQLEDEIEKQYVEGKIYRAVSVNVIMKAQGFFIQGEVKIPGRVLLTSNMTLLQAIAQAGGYTDYADETDVRIMRAGRTSRYNAKDLKRFPERDVRIEPGDVIDVGRSII